MTKQVMGREGTKNSALRFISTCCGVTVAASVSGPAVTKSAASRVVMCSSTTCQIRHYAEHRLPATAEPIQPIGLIVLLFCACSVLNDEMRCADNLNNLPHAPALTPLGPPKPIQYRALS